MARIKRKNKKITKKSIKHEVLSSFQIMIFFVIGLFLFFLAYIEGEHLWQFLHNMFLGLFGVVAMFIGPVFVAFALFYSVKIEKNPLKRKIYQMIMFFLVLCAHLSICASMQIYVSNEQNNLNFFERFKQLGTAWKLGSKNVGGGIIGEFLNLIFSYFFGKQVAFLVFSVLIVMLIFMFAEINFVKFIQFLFNFLKNSGLKLHKTYELNKTYENFNKNKLKNSSKNVSVNSLNIVDEKKTTNMTEPNYASVSADVNKILTINDFDRKLKNSSLANDTIDDGLVFKKNKISTNVNQLNSIKTINDYVFPSIDLLNKPIQINNFNVSKELKINAEILIDTLKSFGVEARIIDISKGPSVTRYELQPSAGVKISRITNLADDISLNLASGGVRIEAPIPNKAAVGIEVPNKKKEMVFLSEIISNEKFLNAKSQLTVSLGKDITGNVVVADLAKMPHILIAGATGSGKSVCVNSLIVSLIYKSSPKDVKLLLIDPKVVELGVYNGIAHLLIPVVVNPKKAAGALNWAVNEMLKRYEIFASNGVRDLVSYNNLIDSKNLKSNEKNLNNSNEPKQIKLPKIVIIIDELADLMMAASKEVENLICRLAQMARAAGMHLVIATQRPSVDVITGLIKANVPSRIAFTVSSQIDSRTILDLAGAEKLLGKGDMLFFPVSEQKPIRVQGCFVDDGEIERVVNFVKNSNKNNSEFYDEKIIAEIEKHAEKNNQTQKNNKPSSDCNDPVFNEAVEIVLNSGQASTSFLQRKLKLGYSRAARIMDEMENAGIVSSANGSKARKILITRQQFLEQNLNKEG